MDGSMTTTAGQSGNPFAKTDQLRTSQKQPLETLAKQNSEVNITDQLGDG